MQFILNKGERVTGAAIPSVIGIPRVGHGSSLKACVRSAPAHFDHSKTCDEAWIARLGGHELLI